MKPTPASIRFMAKVHKGDVCWNWTAYRMPSGYGHFREGGAGSRMVYAHRFSYEIHNGPIPEGMHIDHLCRNKACVNPDHLEAVTCAENIRRGEKTKLTVADVHTIRASAESSRAIASRLGVVRHCVEDVRAGRTWANV